MRRRLYFMLPDLVSATRTANDLLLARIEDRHMHFLARRGMSLGELHSAGYFLKSDIRHSLYTGLLAGGLCGFLGGMAFYFTPTELMKFQPVTILIMTLAGAAFGTWAASLIGISTPNTALRRFQDAIEEGRILLMVDVPKHRIDEIRTLMHNRHAEALDHGLEPSIPAFP